MAKYLGWSSLTQNFRYIISNAGEMILYLAPSSTLTVAQLTALGSAFIVSALVSATDFTLASANAGAVLTIGAKNNQLVEGSGNATHLYLVTSSGGAAAATGRILLVTTVSAQILASGNTVNIASWTVTALMSANNS